MYFYVLKYGYYFESNVHQHLLISKKFCLRRFWYHRHIPWVGKPQAAKKKDHVFIPLQIVYNNKYYRYKNQYTWYISTDCCMGHSRYPLFTQYKCISFCIQYKFIFQFVQERKKCMKIRTTSVPRSKSNRLSANLSFS